MTLWGYSLMAGGAKVVEDVSLAGEDAPLRASVTAPHHLRLR
jgi:hypothetical protein